MNIDYTSFVRESNLIERIAREPILEEVAATQIITALTDVRVEDVQRFVSVCQPDAVLRQDRGQDVRVGHYVAPPGGQHIYVRLQELLAHASQGSLTPWRLHVAYEMLHPFTDGNGRSGRALWLWRMIRHRDRRAELGFLHAFYYQTLEQPL